jgi:hypothetical protein
MDALRGTRLQGLWPVKALQHPFHAPTRAAAGRYGSYGQLLASRVCRDSFWRSGRGADFLWYSRRQALCAVSASGRGNVDLPGILTRGSGDNRPILLPMHSCNSQPGCARRYCGSALVGRERPIGAVVGLTGRRAAGELPLFQGNKDLARAVPARSHLPKTHQEWDTKIECQSSFQELYFSFRGEPRPRALSPL